jgi:NADH:ubiquinone reductase (H+-translocating)
MRLGDPVDDRPTRRERMARPELVTAKGASMGTRAVRTGRHAGREGRIMGDPPLPPPSDPLASGVIEGMLVGVLAWAVLSLTLLPALGATASSLFPVLLVSLCASGMVGPGLQAALRQRHRRGLPAGAAPLGRRRVVIVGGGFGGVSVARRLEQLLPWMPGLDVTLVSRSNYLLFTPMLMEVAAGSVGSGHVSVPLRAACPRTRFRQAEVSSIDPAAQLVHVRGQHGAVEPLPYDHLVLALGAVPNVCDLPGVAANALTLKTLEDARRLRDHVIGRLEQADLETDPRERRRWLTFVVAGGGFAGTEAVAGVFDLVHSVLSYFPHVQRGEPRFVLVHSRERILPELGARLAGHAHRRLQARGIQLRLGVTVVGASQSEVRLSDGELLPARTLIWAAGSRPSPLLGALPLAQRGGAVLVDPTLRVRGSGNVWALGDCARVPDVERGGAPQPPTAQHAERQGKAVAENLVAAMTGKPPAVFRYRGLGFLVPLGHQSAAAEIRGMRFSGLPAWLLWRGVYLWKLPGLEKRLRVLLDWTIELFFPRDIALTAGERRGGPDPSARRRARQPAA